MKTFREFVSEGEHKDWSNHPDFNSSPWGKGTASRPHFPTMGTSMLKKYVESEQYRLRIHGPDAKRDKLLAKAAAEHSSRK